MKSEELSARNAQLLPGDPDEEFQEEFQRNFRTDEITPGEFQTDEITPKCIWLDAFNDAGGNFVLKLLS
jgi:hypothetical protein